MSARIFNREEFQHPTDGWYMIQPFGNFPNAGAGVVQVIDAKAADAMVNRFNADAAKPNFPGMLVDHEHFRHDTDKETVAYGWLTKLSKRDDGIYGQVRWTSTGQAAVDGGSYRFFSTEFDKKDCQTVSDGEPRKIRPLRLDGLTLTNEPNTKGGRPITNRREAAPPQTTPQPRSFMTRKEIFIVNRTRELDAEAVVNRRARLPLSFYHDQARQEADAQFGPDDAPIANRTSAGAAPDHRAVMSRATEMARAAGRQCPTPGEVRQAQSELNCAPSAEIPVVRNRNAAGQQDAAAITNRAEQIKLANPKMALATAYRLAQNEVGSSPSGTLRNRAAGTPDKIRALCQLVFDAGRGSANFEAGWDRMLKAHPALFEELGFDVPDEETPQS